MRRGRGGGSCYRQQEYRRRVQGRTEWIWRHKRLAVRRREGEETKGGEGDQAGERDRCSHQHDCRAGRVGGGGGRRKEGGEGCPGELETCRARAVLRESAQNGA